MPAGYACVELLETRALLSLSPAGAISGTATSVPPIAVVPTPGQVVSVPLTIQAVSGDSFSGDVGMLKGLDPAVLSRLTASINWGDSRPITSGALSFDSDGLLHVQGDHTYARAGKYRLSVSVVLNPPPGSMMPSLLYQINSTAVVTQSSVGGVIIRPIAGQSFTSAVGTFKAPLIDQSASPVRMLMDAQITWGDGTTSAGTIVRNATGQYKVVGTHTYAKSGPYRIRITVTAHPPTSPGPMPMWVMLVANILSTAIVRPAPFVF